MQAPFTLGDHTFLDPGQTGSLSRFKTKYRAPIANAPPPGFLAGYTRSPAASDASRILITGEFCGHGEPTFTVFDIVINGKDHLDIATYFSEDENEEEDDEPREAGIIIARARAAKGPWLVVFSEEWRDEHGDMHVPQTPELKTFDPEEESQVMEVAQPGFLSIGFEYPCDAGAIDEISWIAVDACPEGDEDGPYFLVSTETR
ncbi:MAG: hypothetical protein KF912_05440 [Phycisphaeraceae bacterium]|nr:hypothetical protein [Phycisphaeraceae bacterium]MBX3366741.1 hypothetical protein [Phycisphaeraceae bacterium]